MPPVNLQKPHGPSEQHGRRACCAACSRVHHYSACSLPCDYFGAQTQRRPCVMYPSYTPTWWCQICALNTCFSPPPLHLGPLAARRQTSTRESAADACLHHSLQHAAALLLAQRQQLRQLLHGAQAAAAWRSRLALLLPAAALAATLVPNRAASATKSAQPPLTLATRLASPGQPNPRSGPHTLLLPLPAAAAAAATATAAAAAA